MLYIYYDDCRKNLSNENYVKIDDTKISRMTRGVGDRKNWHLTTSILKCILRSRVVIVKVLLFLITSE
jgi:hypothetical protein